MTRCPRCDKHPDDCICLPNIYLAFIALMVVAFLVGVALNLFDI